MKVKDRQMDFKIPKLWFNYNYANGWFITYLIILLMNFLISFTTSDTFGFIGLSIITVITWAMAVGFAAGPGEAFKRNYQDDFEKSVGDLKKSIVYLFIFCSGFLIYHSLNKPIELPPAPTPTNLSIKVASFQVYDVHKDDKDSYAIKYFDADGQEIWYDSYKEKKDRDSVINRIYDTQGKVKVDMIYKRIDGQRYLEILDKPISLN